MYNHLLEFEYTFKFSTKILNNYGQKSSFNKGDVFILHCVLYFKN